MNRHEQVIKETLAKFKGSVQVGQEPGRRRTAVAVSVPIRESNRGRVGGIDITDLPRISTAILVCNIDEVRISISAVFGSAEIVLEARCSDLVRIIEYLNK